MATLSGKSGSDRQTRCSKINCHILLEADFAESTSRSLVMAETEHARNVCQACTLRKKACDKVLPACGFCSKRGMVCRYDLVTPGKSHHRAYNPGRNFVKTSSPVKDHSRLELAIEEQLLFEAYAPTTLDKNLDRSVRHIFRCINLHPNKVGESYFKTFHRWLPVLSPEPFYLRLAKYRTQHHPPADFSILLLAMGLIMTLPDSGSIQSGSVRGSLYVATKSLFARVQAAISSSLHLVQASLLIATCEYASTHPQDAHISMSTCVGLVRLLNFEGTSYAAGEDDSAEKTEQTNIAWSLATLERCER